MKRELPGHLRGMPEWEKTQAIIAAFFTTYNALGFGFLESVYREALAFELRSQGHVVVAEFPVRVRYREHPVGYFRADLLVDERVVVETKATSVLGPTDKRQLLNYLRATTLDVGLLLHYGPEPKFHRLVSPRALGITPRR
jgi:GxxExxY protein